MRRTSVFGGIVTAALLLAGCATTEPIWFIATPGYVDSRIAVSEQEVRSEYEAEVQRLEAELAEQRRVSEELSGLADIIEEVDQSNRELRVLADSVEQRLEVLPRETIALLVEVLTGYLETEQ